MSDDNPLAVPPPLGSIKLMAGLLYVCPSCSGEASVPDEYVGQTVQCPHCDQLFVATPPVSASDQQNPVVSHFELPPLLAQKPPPIGNPAEYEILPPSQDTFERATTLRQMLMSLAAVVAPGELWFYDGVTSSEPSQLLVTLPRAALDAKIVTRGSDGSGEYIETQTPGIFSGSKTTYRLVWSPNREGWACWPGANTMHYFIPKTAIENPPYCSDGMLVSLCKRDFYSGQSPMHRSVEAKRCALCIGQRGKMLGYTETKKAKAKAVRITLTKTQIESGAGRRLVQLISTLADDRVLQSSELEEFRKSLNAPDFQELAATHWLKENLDEILADGYVTRDEYYSITSAILRVLPPAIRSDWEARMRSGDRPATDRQVDYIRSLGGKVTDGMTVKEASNVISTLLKERGEDSDNF